jgi:hypothetical protein
MSDPRWRDADPSDPPTTRGRRPPGAPDRHPGMRDSGPRKPTFTPAPTPAPTPTPATTPRARPDYGRQARDLRGDSEPQTRRLRPPAELPGPRGRDGAPGRAGTPDRGTTGGREPWRRGGSGIGRGGSGMAGRLGTLSGGFGVGIVVASAVLGAIITDVLGHDPGTLLGVFVIIGTLIAGLAVRARSVRLLIPAPALCYLAAATLAGAVNDRSTDTSHLADAVHIGTWIANGFVAMTMATILAIVLTIGRWFVDWRSRPGSARGTLFTRSAARRDRSLQPGQPSSRPQRPRPPADATGSSPRPRPNQPAGATGAQRPRSGQPGDASAPQRPRPRPPADATRPVRPVSPGTQPGPTRPGTVPGSAPGSGPGPGKWPQQPDRYSLSSGA